MFGKNEIVGQKWFREKEQATEGKLFVTSIFYTLQGEGVYAGMPAVFIRLAKCNLNCSFCDTFFDDGDWLSQSEVIERVVNTVIEFHGYQTLYRNLFKIKLDEETEKLLNTLRNTVLVCTGGEPMLQENLRDFLDFFQDWFKATQIESNGLIWQELPETTTLICSPKCSEKAGKYLNPNDKVLARANALKFVISADPESPYHTVPQWAIDKAGEIPVYVSPMNIYNDAPMKSKQLRMETNQISLKQRSEIDEVISFWEPDLLNMEENQKNHEYAAKYALRNGLRLNLQMHLYASLA